MRKRPIFGKMLLVLFALQAVCALSSFAQTGVLRGGSVKLTNGTNVATIVPPTTPTPYTLTFPTDTSIGIRYLYNDGTGQLNWGNPIGATANQSTVLYNTSTQQTVTNPTAPLFNVGYAAGGTGPAVGAKISAIANGGSNTFITALSDTAANIKTSNRGSSTFCYGILDTAYNLGSGTQIALRVSVTGGGNNYAAITKGGRVGIGLTNPTDTLQVDGNIRISGLNGLKITEGSNSCMGTATLAAGTVVVSTTKVTANSRILLTTQTPGGTVAKPYVSARTAGTSFTITSTNALDLSTVAWMLIEP